MDGVTVIQYLIVRQPNNFLLCGFHSKKYFDYSVLLVLLQCWTKSDFLLQCWKRPCLFFLAVQRRATRGRRSKDSREKQYFAFWSPSVSLSAERIVGRFILFLSFFLTTFQLVRPLSSLLLLSSLRNVICISGIEIARLKWPKKNVLYIEAGGGRRFMIELRGKTWRSKCWQPADATGGIKILSSHLTGAQLGAEVKELNGIWFT